MAQAYKNSGKPQKAITTYQKVLRLNKYNLIAKKNLDYLKLNSHGGMTSASVNSLASAEVFLEEPGKTKLITLVNLAPSTKIVAVSPREKLEITVKRKSVFVIDQRHSYLGSLPDDMSFRIMKFLKSGYRYDCYAKTVEKNNLIVLIRETQRSKKLNNLPTFPLGANEHDFLAINAPESSPSRHNANDTTDKTDSYLPKELAVENEAEQNDADD